MFNLSCLRKVLYCIHLSKGKGGIRSLPWSGCSHQFRKSDRTSKALRPFVFTTMSKCNDYVDL